MRKSLAGWCLLVATSGFGCASAGARFTPTRPDPFSRMETLSRILVFEDSRSLGAGAIQGFLENDDPSIRRRAAIAAGRIGDPLAGPSLTRRLKDPVKEVAQSAAFALGLIGSKDSTPALLEALKGSDPELRGRAAEALGRIGAAAAALPIAEAFRAALPRSEGAPLKIRGDDPGRADDPWIELRLEVFALARLKNADALSRALLDPNGNPVVDWWASAWAAMRTADAKLTPILVAAAGAEDPAMRALAARGFGNLKSVEHLEGLRRLAEDREPSVVLQALRAVAAVGDPKGADIASFFLDSPNLILRREALLAIGALRPDSRFRARVIESVGHPDPWIRSAAWPALIKLDADDVGLVLSTIGPDHDWQTRTAIASALAQTLGEKSRPFLTAMLQDTDTRVVSAVLGALARALRPAAAPLLLERLGDPDPGVRAAAIEGLGEIESGSDLRFTEAFSKAFDSAMGDGQIETRLTLVDVVGKVSSEERRVLLRRFAAMDASRVIRQRALSALGEGFASPEETAARAADARKMVSVYAADSNVFAPRAVLTTRYGRIEILLDIVDTPLASMSFARLAQSGYFNGLTFHRVVPSFVAQGGDPRGDGSGGPAFTIRCEYSARPFGRGSVGMALSGKDTGGSQFFITLEPQPHLDGNYAQFGRVTSGMEVVDRLKPGDVIERIEIFDGRGPR